MIETSKDAERQVTDTGAIDAAVAIATNADKVAEYKVAATSCLASSWAGDERDGRQGRQPGAGQQSAAAGAVVTAPVQMWMGCPSVFSAASNIPSLSVGWAKIVPATSSSRAPVSMARLNAADSSEIPAPTP